MGVGLGALGVEAGVGMGCLLVTGGVEAEEGWGVDMDWGVMGIVEGGNVRIRWVEVEGGWMVYMGGYVEVHCTVEACEVQIS